MAELVYPPVIAVARSTFRLLDVDVRVSGAGRLPATGGAILASNHVSYLDFLFVGLAGLEADRLVRFMAKQEVFTHRLSGPLMRGMHHIPVDRAAGRSSYAEALAALGRGEVVGMFPEGTISRSFTVKRIKTGAARLAAEAGVPLLPVATWGGQRLWTKGRPRRLHRHTPVLVEVGAPIVPAAGDTAMTLTRVLSGRMAELLDGLQARYPVSPAAGEEPWWLPVHRGGTAPTPDEAEDLDARELRERRARYAARQAG